MNRIKQLYVENKEEIVFAGKTISFFLAWKLFEYVIGLERIPIERRMIPLFSHYWEITNDWFRLMLLQGASAYFKCCGYEYHIVNRYSLWVPNFGQLNMGDSCVGIKLWYVYSILFIAYKSTIRRKLVFIFAGIIAINVLNMLRIILLLYTLKYYPNSLHFNHDYLFNGSIYLFSILLFMHFVHKSENIVRLHPVELKL